MAAERSAIRSVGPSARDEDYERERRIDRRDFRPEVDFTGNRVYWIPIVAGFLTALSTLALLSLLGLATGLTSINAGQAATQGTPVSEASMNSLLWTGVSGIIAFMLGGFVTGRTSATFDRNWGTLNGMMVFMLMLPFTLWLATVGMGAMAGGLGAFAGGLASGFGPNAPASAANQVAPNLTPTQVTVAVEAVRNAAWAALLGGILALLASGLGGYLGTRRPATISYTTTTTPPA